MEGRYGGTRPPRRFRGRGGRAGQPVGGIAPQTPWSPPHGMLAIEMTPHDDAEACAAAPPALFVDLQEHAVECDGVVACDDTLFLMAEDLVEVVRADRDEGARGISRGAAEGGVVIGHEALLEIAIGGDEG